MYQYPVLNQHEGCFRTDLVTLKHGQKATTTPELTPLVRTTPGGGHAATTYCLRSNKPHILWILNGIVFRPYNPLARKPIGHGGPVDGSRHYRNRYVQKKVLKN
ncbi:hypothetical protein AVEN_215507-1 [Araneus ventricosus]|uniref:Uncharacterized protein n=1 Tax=Araneus ventricosus TaxID=182803 RepID=A0A4Y2BH86_ARAVE|nr:hypothetical protein AVEN_215507-1 [Araneus ventricosus]